MSNLFRITPFLQMKDLPAAVRFFVDVLGFQAHIEGPDFAYVQRESAGIRLSRQTPDSIEERFDHGSRAFLFYVDVNDLEALVEEVKPRLLAAGRSTGQGPKDQPWGQREWWVGGPEGGLIVFGQSYTETTDRPDL